MRHLVERLTDEFLEALTAHLYRHGAIVATAPDTPRRRGRSSPTAPSGGSGERGRECDLRPRRAAAEIGQFALASSAIFWNVGLVDAGHVADGRRGRSG